jgi:hypothetical protein
MKIVFHKIDKPEVKKDQSVNRIVVVDVSGSMSNDLPKLRQHLKNKLPSLVSPKDSLSLVWFSGRNECGTIFENIKIATATDLSTINAAIDRFLKPIGATGFVSPLEEVKRIISNSDTDANAMYFMTDGGENQSPKTAVYEMCEQLSEVIDSSIFIEYGYYADHDTLTMMAEAVGGEVIGASEFSSYSTLLEKTLGGNVSGGKRVTIKVSEINSIGFVVGFTDDSYVISVPNGAKEVTVPANVNTIAYFTGSGNLEIAPELAESNRDMSMLVAALVQRGLTDVAVDVAAAIGDVNLFNRLQNAFTKQDYNQVVEVAKTLGTPDNPFYAIKPRNTNLAVDPNAYNVLTLLMDIVSFEGNLLNISHPEFEYRSIGNSRKPREIDGFTPKFVDTDTVILADITTLKFNEDRPNIGLLVRRNGKVQLPDNSYGFTEFDTFIFRNYSIVTDGIVNLKKLPVILTKATHDLLVMNGIPLEPFMVGKTYVIDISSMPVINRSMVTPTTAKEMFTDYFKLYTLRCEQKVINEGKDRSAPGQKFSALYGEEATLFLKKYGISEGGFSPLTDADEKVDPYMAKELRISLAGFSSIPKVSDVRDAIAAGKNLTPSQQAMSTVINTTRDVKEVQQEISSLLNGIVMKKFGIILGKKWFTDVFDYDDIVMMNFPGITKQIKCQAKLVEVPV